MISLDLLRMKRPYAPLKLKGQGFDLGVSPAPPPPKKKGAMKANHQTCVGWLEDVRYEERCIPKAPREDPSKGAFVEFQTSLQQHVCVCVSECECVCVCVCVCLCFCVCAFPEKAVKRPALDE